MRHVVILAAILLAVAALSCSHTNTEEPVVDETSVNWLSYDEGLAQARTTHKPIYIDFTADWCGWCIVMEHETFSDPRVIKMLNEEFVPVRLDIDSERELTVNGVPMTEHDIAKSMYQIYAIPYNTFLEPDGTLIGKAPGYYTADQFLPLLSYVAERPTPLLEMPGPNSASTAFSLVNAQPKD